MTQVRYYKTIDLKGKIEKKYKTLHNFKKQVGLTEGEYIHLIKVTKEEVGCTEEYLEKILKLI